MSGPGILQDKTVLVVDDEHDVLESVQDILEGEVGTVLTASDFSTACTAFELGRIDAAVVDLMGVRGLELLERYSHRVPCLVLTGHAVSPEFLRKAIERNAVAYIPKEEISELARYLRIVLSAPSGMNLWHVWLHPRLDFLRLRVHLGRDFERTEPGFFEGVIEARSHEAFGELRDHEGGVLEFRHVEPPLNMFSVGSIFAYRKLLDRLKDDDAVRAIVHCSGLPPALPSQAIDRLARRPPLRWLGSSIGRGLAGLVLRLFRPGLRRTRFFSTGIPLEATTEPALLQAILEFGKEVLLDVFSYPKPHVMAVEGPALAGGMELVLASHYVVGDSNAFLGLPELRLGFIPPAGIPLLIGRVGVHRAFAICADARLISARRASSMGLIDRLVPVGQTVRMAVRTARKLADRQAVPGLHLARRLVGFDIAEALELSFEEWRRGIGTPAARQAVQRFFRERGKEMKALKSR